MQTCMRTNSNVIFYLRTAGHRWAQGLQLDRETAETDHYLYTHFRERWRRLQEEGKDK